MKIPRDISGISLARKLKKLGYSVTRQTGSHIRLTTLQSGEHHLTIPRHNPLKIGTLMSVLNAVSEHFVKTKEEIIKEIF
jgi:predicted RNA binding protein YcfA (HicA-like mRNA interferase family)